MKRTTDTSPVHDGYNGLYLERSGVGMAQMAEALTLPPERPLSDEEKWTVRQFESDILELRVGIGVTLGDVLQAPLSEGKLAPL